MLETSYSVLITQYSVRRTFVLASLHSSLATLHAPLATRHSLLPSRRRKTKYTGSPRPINSSPAEDSNGLPINTAYKNQPYTARNASGVKG